MTTLLAEDLVLLLLDDESGKLTNTTFADTGIGGSLLVELAMAGSVEVTKGSRRWARAKVVPTGAPVPDDPLLTEAMSEITEKQRSAKDLVSRLGKKRRKVVLDRLQERGLVTVRDDRVLGLFPRRRWPALDRTHKSDVRRQLGAILEGAPPPDVRSSALLALLAAMDLAHKVLPHAGMSKRQVRQRGKEIAEGDWAAKAVRDSIKAAQEATAAVLITMMAAGSTVAGSR